MFKPKLYLKDESFDPIYNSVEKGFFFKSRVLPGLLISMGFVILITQVGLPLVFFKTQNEISKPMASTALGLATGFSTFKFDELTGIGKYKINKANTPEYFYVTIPKLKIENAKVQTNSENLSPDESLGHYAGSGLPGDTGNSFIYGHSVLPWFYNPKNYKTIFSTLGNLEAGDKIEINYDDKKYTYKVESKEQLNPDKVDPLAEFKPKYMSESTITLMTCWPAGTKSKRLLIRAALED